MIRKNIFLALWLFTISLWSNGVLATNKPWAHEKSDLIPDSDVTWGVLENGFRYAIMPNQEPPEHISLRLYVNAGSLMEEEDEQGLAHFLEHMAFNGSDHFEPGELFKYLERLGMESGADTNAHTSLDETVYKLDLPKNTEEYINEGLTVMRDYAGGLHLGEKEVDRERGVILQEKVLHDDIRYRTFVSQWEFLYPHTLLYKRLPIGKEEVIRTIPQSKFVKFYQKWYRPDRMVLVVVGDVDVQKVEQVVRDKYSSLERRGDMQVEPDLGRINSDFISVKLHSEPEAPETTISISSVQPYVEKAFTHELFKQRLYERITASMLNRRLAKLSKEENAPFTEGSYVNFDYLQFLEGASISLSTQPAKWKDVLMITEQELRKAIEYGFNESELQEAKSNYLLMLKDAVGTASTRKSRALAMELVNSIGEDVVFMSPQQELNMAESALAELNLEKAHTVFNRLWEMPGRQIFVSGNLVLEEPEEMILLVYQQSQAQPVVAHNEEKVKPFAYEEFGPSGKTVDRDFVDQLNIHQITFANNLKLNIKKTDFEANTIHIVVRFGRGLLEEPEDKPGLHLLADSVFELGGLQEHSYEDINRLMAGKKLTFIFDVAPDAFIISGTTNQEDLRAQLNLITAYIKEPGYREEALRQAHKYYEEIYTSLDNTPKGVMSSAVRQFLASDDQRFGYPGKERFFRYTLEDVKTWLQDALEHSAMEISIVGDVDIEETVDQVGLTLGTLPLRASRYESFSSERQIQFPEGPIKKVFSVQSRIPKSISAVYWPTVDMSDIRIVRRLNVLASIISNRMMKEIRENEGEAYTPYAYNHSALEFPDYGYLVAMIPGSSSNTERVLELTQSLSQEIAKEGFSDDEFIRALNPRLENVKVVIRNNSYWLSTVLSGSTEYPEKFDWAKTMVEDYNSITAKEVRSLAKEFLRDKRTVSIIVTPDV